MLYSTLQDVPIFKIFLGDIPTDPLEKACACFACLHAVVASSSYMLCILVVPQNGKPVQTKTT